MKVQIDPKENRSEHIKAYVEPSLVDAIRKFQNQYGGASFSEAVRTLILMGLNGLPNVTDTEN